MAGKKPSPKKKERIKQYYATGRNVINKKRKHETAELKTLRNMKNKKRRLIARLKTFNVDANTSESVNSLRKKLNQFIRKPNLISEWMSLRDKLLDIFGGNRESIKAKR